MVWIAVCSKVLIGSDDSTQGESASPQPHLLVREDTAVEQLGVRAPCVYVCVCVRGGRGEGSCSKCVCGAVRIITRIKGREVSVMGIWLQGPDNGTQFSVCIRVGVTDRLHTCRTS